MIEVTDSNGMLQLVNPEQIVRVAAIRSEYGSRVNAYIYMADGKCLYVQERYSTIKQAILEHTK